MTKGVLEVSSVVRAKLVGARGGGYLILAVISFQGA
jgi:hypothetical protein